MHIPRQHGNSGQYPSNHSGPPKDIVSYEVALRNKKQIAVGTFAFTFEKPKGFQFTAGQHVRMTLIKPPETDNEGNSRFLTIASSPGDNGIVFAMRMRDTAFKRVLRNMQVGDKVLIQMLLHSPHGSFALHEDVSKPAVFLIGGIGIVPAFSMIKDACERKLAHKIFLFYSNRRPEDAPFLKELVGLAKQNPSFKLVATITEAEKSAGQWQGETGRIDNSMLKKYVDDIKSPVFYLAGLPEMVSSMKVLLKGAGVNENSILAEEFTGFNLNEINNGANRSSKSHASIAIIAIGIVALIVIHTGIVKSLFPAGIRSLSFKNPATYLSLGFILVIIVVKLKLASMGFKHSKRKRLHKN